MRASASSARRAGFTLVEVMIAATILAVVLGIALRQISDTAGLSKILVARADMRRVGEPVLHKMADDIGSCSDLAVSVYYSGGSGSGTSGPSGKGSGGNVMAAVECYKVNPAGAFGNTSVANNSQAPHSYEPAYYVNNSTLGDYVIYRYFQTQYVQNTTSTASNQLLFERCGQAELANATPMTLLTELASPTDSPPGLSFQIIPGGSTVVTALSSGPFLSSSNNNSLGGTSGLGSLIPVSPTDRPYTLIIRLRMQRLLGQSSNTTQGGGMTDASGNTGSSAVVTGVATGGGRSGFVADVVLETQVAIRASVNSTY